jgi:hypothetical protein
LERISNIAGKAMKKSSDLSVLKSSLNNNQAAKMGINNDSRWAASVLRSPYVLSMLPEKENGRQ